MAKLTRKEALKRCVKMWDWLADNPDKDKEDYFTFGPGKKYKIRPQSDCWACEYNFQHESAYCNVTCIIPIFTDYWQGCTSTRSLFILWEDANGYQISRSKYARQIADSARNELNRLTKGDTK